MKRTRKSQPTKIAAVGYDEGEIVIYQPAEGGGHTVEQPVEYRNEPRAGMAGWLKSEDGFIGRYAPETEDQAHDCL